MLALELEGNLPFLLCFALYLREISKYKPPGGLIFGAGQFYEFGGLIFGGAYAWRGTTFNAKGQNEQAC